MGFIRNEKWRRKCMVIFRCCCKCVIIVYSLCGMTRRETQHSNCLEKKKQSSVSHVYCSKHTLEDNTVCLKTSTSGQSFPLKCGYRCGILEYFQKIHKKSILRNLRALRFKNTLNIWNMIADTFPACSIIPTFIFTAICWARLIHF